MNWNHNFDISLKNSSVILYWIYGYVNSIIRMNLYWLNISIEMDEMEKTTRIF